MGYAAVPRYVRRCEPARALRHQRPKRIRIVIADGQPIFCQGLRRVIETQSDLWLVAETSDGAEAVKLMHKYSPDVLLLDLAVSGLAALNVLRSVHSSASQVRSIVLANEIETCDAHQALKLGAHGVMRKDSSAELLLKGVRSVMAGECWMARENMANFLTWLGNGTSPSADVPTGNHLHLTSRELQIVSAIIEGETNKGIAVRLGLSENTVKHHLTHVFDKLGVSSRLELAVFAQRVFPRQ